MARSWPDKSCPEKKMSWHASWALAVGGMIGGGIYTLAGVILGVAGPLAWLSLVLGSVIALLTVRSYAALTLEIAQEGVPVSFLLVKGRYRTATVTVWWLLLVYVLAMAVYAFTFSQYVGRALGIPPVTVALLVVGIITALAVVNLCGLQVPANVQIAAVWVELSILALLALSGFLRWNPENVVSGVPSGSFAGVIAGMAATFIAFEGFEMLAYDVRELRHPRRALKTALPAAILSVAAAYALVTLGAASLVGAGGLAEQKENALAIAGSDAAGTVGLVVVTIAACASAASAINATLFSVARLARSAAESRLIPGVFARVNRNHCPYWGVLVLGVAAAVLSAVSSLEPLVQSASLAFLVLFAFVNTLAFVESRARSVLAGLGAAASIGAAGVVTRSLALDHPLALGAFAAACALSVLGYVLMRLRRRARGEPPLRCDPRVQTRRRRTLPELRERRT